MPIVPAIRERSLARLRAERVDDDLVARHVNEAAHVRHAVTPSAVELERREVEPELAEHHRLPSPCRAPRPRR